MIIDFDDLDKFICCTIMFIESLKGFPRQPVYDLSEGFWSYSTVVVIEINRFVIEKAAELGEVDVKPLLNKQFSNQIKKLND